MRKKILIFTASLLIFIMAGCGSKKTYGVFIGADYDKIKMLTEYETVVIDAAGFSKKEITQIKEKGTRVFSYLNIGSIEEFRDYYDEFTGKTLGEYENWSDEYWMDVSDPFWQAKCLELAEELKNKGIDGFFIDNCDVYYNFPTDEIYNGLTTILTQLSEIDKDIIINGGDEYVTRYLDNKAQDKIIFKGVNQECVCTAIDFSEGKFIKADADSKEYFTEYLNKLQKNGYDVYVIEYSTDKNLSNQSQKYAEKNNWTIYLSDSLNLD